MRWNVRHVLLTGGLLACLGGISHADVDPPADALQPEHSRAWMRSYQKLDVDRNGLVSLKEFLADVPAEQREKLERNFKVMDFDRNGDLSPEEFRAVTGVDVPDPWIKLADAAHKSLQDVFRNSDRNQDGKLSSEEWTEEVMLALPRPFDEIEFFWWDADKDQSIDGRELRRMVDLAYGVRVPSGEPARWPNGSVLYWSHLKDIDKTGDYVLSQLEFIVGHWLGAEKNEALFPKLDRNGDGELSYAEISAPDSPFHLNLVSTFYAFDKDLDGRLSRAELAEQCPAAQNNPRALELGLAAFDPDGDGFDLDEFRLSPLGLLYVTVQLLHKKDVNQDGAISWAEFYYLRPEVVRQPAPNAPLPAVKDAGKPLFIGIAWEVFRRYDRDRDGELSPEEYDFPANDQLTQAMQQWEPMMRQVVKTELRYFLSICALNDAQKREFQPLVLLTLRTLTRQMAAATHRPQNVNGRIVQSQFPDVQALCIERFRQFAVRALPADVAANYRREIDQRSEQRREATILALVARLDRHLLLIDEQREQIAKALRTNWQPAWMQQIEIVMQNEQIVLQLPDACVAPHLTQAQKEVWNGLAKSSFDGQVRFEQDVEELAVVQGGNPGAGEEADLEFLLPPPQPRRLRGAVRMGGGIRVQAEEPAPAPVRKPALQIRALDVPKK